MTTTTLAQTPLRNFHLDHGAQMVDFAGWEMPLKYQTSVREEHAQCRASGAIFDVSHMGRLSISGLHAKRLLERACSRRIGDMQDGQCRYSLMCNAQGGVKDDVIVMRIEADDYLVVVNASNRAKIVDHLKSLIAERSLNVKFEDRTEKTAMVALQGPRVMDLISGVSKEIPSLKRYRFAIKNLMIMKLFVSRTGYTGEDGVEVILPASAVGMAMKLLLKDVKMDEADALLRPAGLAARDSLRLEAGMPLYGHELGEEINALSCGVDFAISLDKSVEKDGETFVGQEALLKTREGGGPESKLVGIEIEGKRTARQGMPILVGGQASGTVTSGCLSPTLEKSIAMGFVSAQHAAEGAEVAIDTGKVQLGGRIVPLPFYKAPKK
ncbi:MAG: glycine cleavage system aminomethyltransferase GcvT [Planctomycetota bacterium]|nr:MAG: glycine cleavage system aminomethyltransferase GcvT [Planctomycetota bacterium]